MAFGFRPATPGANSPLVRSCAYIGLTTRSLSTGTIVVLAATVVSLWPRTHSTGPSELQQLTRAPPQQLLVLVSVSVPITKSIYFLKANITADVQGVDIKGTVTLGCWGYCIGDTCTKSQFGYNLGSLPVLPLQFPSARKRTLTPDFLA